MILRAVLTVLALAGEGSVARAQELEPAGSFVWVTEAVTELSAIEVEGGGRDFTAISDRGWLLRGRFDRDTQGAISGVTVQEIAPILGNDGMPVAARRVGDWADAEGLATAPDGGCWISFERWAHVAHYDGCRGPGQWIKDAPGFATLPDNGQLEALALSPDGMLYTIAETAQEGGFAIWRLEEAHWSMAGRIPETDGFAVTGADFGEDGWMYIIERKLVMGLWWQARIRRLRTNDAAAPEVLWTSRRGAYGNIEGISVWRSNNANRLTLVTDDNESREERTTIIELSQAAK